jgi:Cu+-exporting ATPase
LFGVEDPLRPSAMLAVEELQRSGVEVVMATGDHPATARLLAQRLGIERVLAEVTPTGKVDAVDGLKKEGRVVAMAGDGVADAGALAQADVGVALGTGPEAALSAAGLTLMSGDLQALVRARTLSQATMKTARQNLALALGYNALAVPLAAGALYPLLGALLSPMVAGAAMSLSTMSVLGNSLRLRGSRLS